MRQQLKFDIQLICNKKMKCISLLGICLFYVLLDILSGCNRTVHIILTMFVSIISYHTIFDIICTNMTSDHLRKSTYSTCVYLPMKKKAYVWSKIIIASMIFVFLYLLNILSVILVDHFIQPIFDLKLLLFYFILLFISWTACVFMMAVTYYSAKAFHFGGIIAGTLIGISTSGFLEYHGWFQPEQLSVSLVMKVVGICIVMIGCAVFLGQYIAKKVSV